MDHTQSDEEVVVSLSKEIDLTDVDVETPALDLTDQAVANLLSRFDSLNVGSSPNVLNEVDLLFADDAFYGTVFDASDGRAPNARMSRGMQAAILRGTAHAISQSAALSQDPILTLFDELDSVPNTDEPLQQVLRDSTTSEVSSERDAADRLGEYVRGIEDGAYVPSDSNVVAIEFGRLIKATKIRREVAFKGVRSAVSHARQAAQNADEHTHLVAAGLVSKVSRVDWEGFLTDLQEALELSDTDVE